MSSKYRFSCGCEWPILEGVPYIGEIPALDFDIDNAPTSCPATWALLGRGESKGVFQLESPLGKQWTKKLRPESIEHMGALGALLRPGCLRAVDSEGISMTAHYARRKNGEEETRSYHPAIDAILAPTYNVLTYQEQAMAIAQAVAGFNLQEADSLRKAIGKKLAEEMAKCKKMFMDGAKKAGILTDEQAAEVFGWIQESQRYSFNKSHAISYGLVGYQCAYIKAHFPLIFFTSWLSNAGDKDEVYDLVQDAKLVDVEVLPPNLLSRKADFSHNGKVVEFGISNISGVGPSAITTIFEQAKVAEATLGKPLKDFSWVEFLFTLTGPGKISSDIMRNLIRAGALRWMGTNRRRMEAEYDAWLELVKKDTAFKWGAAHMQSAGWKNVVEALYGIAKTKKNGGGCHSQPTADKLLGEIKLLTEPPTCIDDTPHWIAWAEEMLLGISLSCSQLDSCDLSQVNTSIRDYRNGHSGFLMFGVKVEHCREVKTKKGKAVGSKMAFMTVSDQTGSLEDVVAFPETWKEFGSLVTPGALIILQGERQKDDSLSVKKVWSAA